MKAFQGIKKSLLCLPHSWMNQLISLFSRLFNWVARYTVEVDLKEDFSMVRLLIPSQELTIGQKLLQFL